MRKPVVLALMSDSNLTEGFAGLVLTRFA